MVLISTSEYDGLVNRDKEREEQEGGGDAGSKNQTFHINQVNQNQIESGARVNIKGETRGIVGKSDKTLPRKFFDREDFYPKDNLSDNENEDEEKERRKDDSPVVVSEEAKTRLNDGDTDVATDDNDGDVGEDHPHRGVGEDQSVQTEVASSTQSVQTDPAIDTPITTQSVQTDTQYVQTEPVVDTPTTTQSVQTIPPADEYTLGEDKDAGNEADYAKWLKDKNETDMKYRAQMEDTKSPYKMYDVSKN